VSLLEASLEHFAVDDFASLHAIVERVLSYYFYLLQCRMLGHTKGETAEGEGEELSTTHRNNSDSTHHHQQHYLFSLVHKRRISQYLQRLSMNGKIMFYL